jgi:hypothetical protein
MSGSPLVRRPRLDQSQGLDVFPIKAELDKPDPRIKPGMTPTCASTSREAQCRYRSINRSCREGKAFVKRVIEQEETAHQRVEVVLGTRMIASAEVPRV